MDKKKLINYQIDFSEEEWKKIKASGYTVRELFLIGLTSYQTEQRCKRGEIK